MCIHIHTLSDEEPARSAVHVVISAMLPRLRLLSRQIAPAFAPSRIRTFATMPRTAETAKYAFHHTMIRVKDPKKSIECAVRLPRTVRSSETLRTRRFYTNILGMDRTYYLRIARTLALSNLRVQLSMVSSLRRQPATIAHRRSCSRKPELGLYALLRELIHAGSRVALTAPCTARI